ncbi:protein-export chaperone SecB [Lentibacillus cibarius]|uniref:Preprotein translocase subunit SecB n=1 Tax=Lentibacillus cibarius TaxID=2583219 RepID=A0A5S3QJ83_9BACI|nr:protein-export chaperone SecB [Lentibacillus cibarius]TMN21925.1 hypothetical protein FFL34_07195 [Lentibacillus cibarius]
MESILSFDDYDVIESIYYHNPYIDLESENVSPDFKLNIKYGDKERTEAALFFSIELGDKSFEENSFYLKATILGVFSIGNIDDTNEEFVDHLYKKNSLAILYPYMRSLVSDVSSKGGDLPIILPPINVGAMAEKQDFITEEYDNE